MKQWFSTRFRPASPGHVEKPTRGPYASYQLHHMSPINWTNQFGCPPAKFHEQLNHRSCHTTKSAHSTLMTKSSLSTMTSPVFALYITCLFLGKTAQATDRKDSGSVHQQHRFISVKSGENLTLLCFYDGTTTPWFYWYKQTLGEKPRLISFYFKYDKNVGLSDEFKSDPRFTLDADDDRNHLTITDLHISDSATYVCVRHHTYAVEFAEVITVSVEGSAVTVPAVVHQSTSGSIQSGDSVTLNCTVHTGTCDGEHSVYWFKHSEESHPGLIYTHGGRNDQCERKDNTHTHTCVYNLPLKDLDVSHAGTYYCAVASCGHILFGNGTKLHIKDDRVLVYLLSSALAFTTILVIILAFSVYRINKRSSSQSSETQARLSAASTRNTEGNTDNLHYAALNVKKPRNQNNSTNNDCVYSSVKM
ncbi:uncharacterized protein V6R79_003863 [Siganus canaliculatus]